MQQRISQDPIAQCIAIILVNLGNTFPVPSIAHRAEPLQLSQDSTIIRFGFVFIYDLVFHNYAMTASPCDSIERKISKSVEPKLLMVFLIFSSALRYRLRVHNFSIWLYVYVIISVGMCMFCYVLCSDILSAIWYGFSMAINVLHPKLHEHRKKAEKN